MMVVMMPIIPDVLLVPTSKVGIAFYYGVCTAILRDSMTAKQELLHF
jgi:hypothetical protein